MSAGPELHFVLRSSKPSRSNLGRLRWNNIERESIFTHLNKNLYIAAQSPPLALNGTRHSFPIHCKLSPHSSARPVREHLPRRSHREDGAHPRSHFPPTFALDGAHRPSRRINPSILSVRHLHGMRSVPVTTTPPVQLAPILGSIFAPHFHPSVRVGTPRSATITR